VNGTFRVSAQKVSIFSLLFSPDNSPTSYLLFPSPVDNNREYRLSLNYYASASVFK
jgi:hypothetical protein